MHGSKWDITTFPLMPTKTVFFPWPICWCSSPPDPPTSNRSPALVTTPKVSMYHPGKRAMLGPSKTPYPVTKQPPFHLANAQSNHVIPVFQPKIAAQMPNWVGKKKRKDRSFNGNSNFPHSLVEWRSKGSVKQIKITLPYFVSKMSVQKPKRSRDSVQPMDAWQSTNQIRIILTILWTPWAFFGLWTF